MFEALEVHTDDEHDVLSCRRLTIPRELRDNIFEYLVVSRGWVIDTYQSHRFSKLSVHGLDYDESPRLIRTTNSAIAAHVALSSTCQQLRSEARA